MRGGEKALLNRLRRELAKNRDQQAAEKNRRIGRRVRKSREEAQREVRQTLKLIDGGQR